MGRRKTPDRAGTRKGWRRCAGRNLIRNPSAVRVAESAVPLGKRRQAMLERETPKSTGCTSKARQPSREPKLGTKMPRGLARQEVALFVCRQLGNPLQVKFDTVGKRFLDFVERWAVGRNIQVDADCFPAVTFAVRIALEVKGHSRLHGLRMVRSDITHQSTIGWPPLHGIAIREPEGVLCHTE